MPTRRKPRYAIFSDESGGAGERVRALAAVHGPTEALQELDADLKRAAEQYQVRDLKWNQVRTRKARLLACQAFLENASLAASQKKICLDVMVWELPEDARRKQREDPAALRGRYAKLLARAAGKWERGEWAFYPDQRTGVDWKGIARDASAPPRFRFAACQPLRSTDSSLIQLADLMAGMARFCREQAAPLKQWLETGRAALRARQNRFQMAQAFLIHCEEKKVRLRLRPKGYFESPGRGTRISFWND